ncbi:MAG: hypothetical protein H0T42_06590 [Deltaproteobacteria bacterium]|nr:hypothetical protein [Deltaproteobacteria bacterium]
MTSPRQILSIAVTIGMIGAFAALALAVSKTVSQPPDVLERKVSDAERHLYYRITAAEGAVFVLTGDETSIRLIVHAVVPGAASGYDQAREIEYGVRVEMELDGKPWHRDLHTRARQSKARWIPEHGGMWLDENTFSLERGLELSDDRHLIVVLPAGVSPGTRLKVTMLTAEEGIVRGYAPLPRADIDHRLDAMRPVDRKRLAEQISYAPWDRLHVRELAVVRFAERRLSDDGHPETREVYTTGYRMRDVAMLEWGTVITAERGLAVNVVGPAQLELAVRRADPSPAPAQLVVTLLGETAAPAPLSIAVPSSDASETHPVSIPEGVFTATISSTGSARVQLTAPPETAIALAGTTGGGPLVADVQRISSYLSGPDGPPIAVALEEPIDQVGRTIRVDVRTLAAAPVATLTLDAVDAEGRTISTVASRIDSVVSRFEVAHLFDAEQALVGEPVGVCLVAPAGAREVRIRTDVPALVAISTAMPGTSVTGRLESPFAEVPLATLMWRYARQAERQWQPVRAKNHAALTPQRTVTLVAQARLERRVVPPAALAGTSLTPVDRLERQTMIERVPSGEVASTVAAWTAGDHTRLIPGRVTRIDFSRSPDRPTLRYFAARSGGADVVGSKLQIKLDGRALDDETLSATGGTMDLPRGLTGIHTLEVETSAPVRLLVDRPPVGGAELYAMRTVYRVPDDGKPIRIRVTKRPLVALTVNVVLYTPRAVMDPATSIRIVVDGGAPTRIEGVALASWTLADRALSLPASDRPATLGFTDTDRGGPLYPRRIAVTIGDDLLPGPHTIELRVDGARPVWGRWFVLDGRSSNEPRAVQWRDDDDPSTGSSE